MPSFFPGMDPFIEGDDWEDFHSNMISAIQAALVPALRPKYVVRTERRVYVEHPDGSDVQLQPDVAIMRGARASRTVTIENPPVMTIEPVECTLMPAMDVEENYLVIRRLDSSEVVTIIELLSPTNKRRGSEGHALYLNKREEILRSPSHLVEIDLLRGGERLPTLETLPVGDYYAFVCRAARRPRAEVYAWALRQALPVIPVPLSAGDADVALDLQPLLGGVYDRAGYDYSLDYQQLLSPALSEDNLRWVKSLLPGSHQSGDPLAGASH